VVTALVVEAKQHLARRELEASLRAELIRLGRPVMELPWLSDGVHLPGLYRLAGALLDPSQETDQPVAGAGRSA
jgi:hypothetical protein